MSIDHSWLSDGDLHYTLDGVICHICKGPWQAHLDEMMDLMEPERPANRRNVVHYNIQKKTYEEPGENQ